jgi:GEVED domain-containing protein/type IX secretion system substrate protein
MTRAKTLSLLIFSSLLLLFHLTTHAQVFTNTAVLQKASHDRALQEADLHRMAQVLAKQKGWPLTIHGKKGRKANLIGVNSKGLPVYITTVDNIISAATIGTNKLWPGGGTGVNLNGSSANVKGKIAIWDEGLVRPTHVELVGRVTQVDGYTVLSDHSTHVSGTMIASGVNPVAKGMANGAQLLNCYNYDNDVSQMFAASPNLLVSNHSYAIIAGWNEESDGNWDFYGLPGDTVDIDFGLYDQTTQLWDSIAYNAPEYLIVKAAGNNRGETGPPVGQTYYRYNAQGVLVSAGARPAGISSNATYNTIATYGCAKDILTVGAVNPIPGGYTTPADVVGAYFSSWGPTGDGRIKPDVVADGVNVLSSISTADNAYDIYSGTSMASPASTGSSLVLQEYFSKLHGGTFMRAATLKGLLIHTADEAGPSPGPDYQFGWGLLDIPKAAAMITGGSLVTGTDSSKFILENNLVNGTHDADSMYVVASGKTPLIGTICWTDPPGNPATIVEPNFADITPKLIDDLDLRITDTATGTVYMPWVLSRTNPSAAATKGDNVLDNDEKVEVDNITPGKTYKIKVTHKGVLARGSQAYSLLLSGAGGIGYCTSGSTITGGTTIRSVSFGGISNTNSAGCHTYSDFTSLAPAQLALGATVPITIGYVNCIGGSSTTNIAVYIDFNNDGNFTDAGDLAFQNSSLLTSGSSVATLTGNITIPTTAVSGAYSRMRIIARDGSSLATPAPCGTYPNGETQDYRVQFSNPANDAGISALEYPTATTCANDSQVVAIHIRNYGTAAQTNVPVTTIIKNGNTVVATLTATCKDSIYPSADVIYTYNTTFPSVAGQTYTFTSYTAIPGDANLSNDSNTATITVSAAAAGLTGTATVCPSNTSEAVLKANTNGNDLAVWYASATADTPIAAGNNTTTTVVPANNTFYLGTNELNTKLGPPNKLAYSGGAGAYFQFQGNLFQFTTSVPLTIESAKMYIGYPGQITFTLVNLVSISYANGYSYIPIYNTTIDVQATAANPTAGQVVNVSAGDNTDTGQVYYLNIPIPTPGSYGLVIDCQNSASAFLNVGNTNIPYPITLPGVMSINSMYIGDGTAGDSSTFPKMTYFPFYNMGIRLAGCPGPRTPVTATTATAPVITLNGNVFTSNFASGNQWYWNGAVIPGATNVTDTAIYTGTYQDIVTDPVTGCTLASNTINFTSTGTTNVTGPQGVKITPNPNPGAFELSFYMATQNNVTVSLVNVLGQRVFEASYPNFAGIFNQAVDVDYLADGMYILQIFYGNQSYVTKIIVKK